MSEGEVIGLCATGVASRENLESLADRVNKKYLSGTAIDESEQDFDPECRPENPYADLEKLLAVEGVSWSALLNFKIAARALKAAESAYRDAQQAYGEAVKRLSEEAVK